MSMVRSAWRLFGNSVRFGALDPLLSIDRGAGLLRWGPSLSALVHASALRWPDRPAVIDDHGILGYRELDRIAERLASALQDQGDGPVGLLARNHRGFVLGYLAIERSGRDLVLLNTALPAGQLGGIVEREELAVIIADAEFHDRLAAACPTTPVLTAEPDEIQTWGSGGRARRPTRNGRVILLTSGTTGPPKGAKQSNSTPTIGDAGLLDALPMELGDVSFLASPLFHAWGFAQATIALATGSTMVLQRRFDAERAMALMVRHDVTLVAAVPIMFSRMLDVTDPKLELPALRAALCSGNVLSATLARRWIDRFGPNLYNLYGSTETAIATVASPQDLVNAPGTVGRPPSGVEVVILGPDDEPVPQGTLGRVFTANSMQFDGYTDGSSKTRSGKLMATGDLGYVDIVGRLFVDGREGDMIVTGGENVFPSQVEEVLEQHPAVTQAAVVGQSDDEFGEVVAAFVVGGADLDMDELDIWARDRLGAFQRPRRWKIVDTLPMTTTGKIKRNELAARSAD